MAATTALFDLFIVACWLCCPAGGVDLAADEAAVTVSRASTASQTCSDEFSCLSASMADSEKQADLEAIRTLHGQLDDDANGNIDLSESDEFLRQELKYENGYEKRQRAFHRDDTHISVRELWEQWMRSEVYNWTKDQTIDWLVHVVQLPQYANTFGHLNIDGSKLPRLAVNNPHYYSVVLGVKDPIHRQKMAVKAMDVVLFGPPKDGRNHIKDATLFFLLVCALLGYWYAYRTDQHSKRHLAKLMQHMEVLSSAEKELQELQIKLEHARQEQDITLSQKEQLERQLEEETRLGSSANLSQTVQLDPQTEEEMRLLREQVDVLRAELQRAEGELDDRVCWAAPPELQHWLQLTYEVEQRGYNKKRLQAEKQLEQAKEACEKLNRKRSSFVASFVSTHDRTIDDVDKSIMEARTSLMEVKQDLQERMTRWRQIESLCGFSITTNPGFNYLETLLRSNLNSSRYVVLNPARHGMPPLDDDGDETSSIVSSSAGIGSSQSNVSMMERPRTSSRQRLSQRENSKDSAIEGSVISSVADDDSVDLKFGGLGAPLASVRPSANGAGAFIRASASAPVTGLSGKATEGLAKSVSLTASSAMDKLVGPPPVFETVRKVHPSPMLSSKSSAHLQRSHQLSKTLFQDGAEFKPCLRKMSQSESALDVASQLSPTKADNESGQDEAQSTDSSLPSVDGDPLTVKRIKKKRFNFSNFVRRSTRK